MGAVSRSSERKSWSIAGGRSGSLERTMTRPRERGFIANAAALASYRPGRSEGSQAGKRKMSHSPCLHSEWGVSAGGERIYLLNDKLEVICAVTYNGVYGGEALGRIPDGAGALCPTNPTAGESNVVSTLR